jgi:hypothetical protein
MSREFVQDEGYHHPHEGPGDEPRHTVQLSRRAVSSRRAQAAELLQRRGGQRKDEAVHESAARGVSGSGTRLPHLDTIQASFGRHDVTDVQAHSGSKAEEANAQLGSEAYATGNSVAFGQSPGLHTAAHEAAHVVQQRSGVSLVGGVGQIGDRYEQNADQVADAVVQGGSAEPILDQMSNLPSASDQGATQGKVQQKDAARGAQRVQRKDADEELDERAGHRAGVAHGEIQAQ